MMDQLSDISLDSGFNLSLTNDRDDDDLEEDELPPDDNRDLIIKGRKFMSWIYSQALRQNSYLAPDRLHKTANQKQDKPLDPTLDLTRSHKIPPLATR